MNSNYLSLFFLFLSVHCSKITARNDASMESKLGFPSTTSSAKVTGVTAQTKYVVGNSEAKTYKLNAGDVVEIRADHGNWSFMILQVHSQRLNITLASDNQSVVGKKVTGKDVGMLLINNMQQLQWYVTNNNKEDINILYKLDVYEFNVPVPGACNLDFPLENDPNMHLFYNHFVTINEFQYADLGIPPHGKLPLSCEDKAKQDLLEYDFYVSHMTEGDLSEEHYLDSLKSMMNGASVDSVPAHSTMVSTLHYRDQTNISIATFPGVGTISTMVVRQKGATTQAKSAAYVTTVTYGCDLSDADKCFYANRLGLQVVCSIAGVVGLFLCFCGHKFFKIEMYLVGFLTVSLVTYLVLSLVTGLDYTVILVLCLTAGVIGGGLWLLFWWYVGVPVISVLLVGLLLGYLITSIVFNLTPMGNLSVWNTAFNYGMAFACGVLVIPVFLLSFTKTLNILTCAIVGSYGVVLAVNAYLHTSLFHILVLSLYKATVPGFLTVKVVVPFQLYDMLLCVGWGVLAIIGMAVQFATEKGKPDFPPCPHQQNKHRQAMMSVNTSQREINNLAGSEREPLLARQRERGRHQHRAEPPPPYTECADENIRTDWGSS